MSEGDQLTAFRKEDRVVDPETGRLLGYHVNFLGWLEVEETYASTSLAMIEESFSFRVPSALRNSSKSPGLVG